jgi:AcrR family transcriptional regulator
MSSPARKVDLRRARGDDTRVQILAAARDALAENGAAATTTRAIAERAGVQLSLVHYHFGGKQQLLAAVLDLENERLLERQRELFAGPDTLAEKWRSACAYLRDDLGSGYVRILWELWAAGLDDEELAARWRGAIAGWRSCSRVPYRSGRQSKASTARSRRMRSRRSSRTRSRGPRRRSWPASARRRRRITRRSRVSPA